MNNNNNYIKMFFRFISMLSDSDNNCCTYEQAILCHQSEEYRMLAISNDTYVLFCIISMVSIWLYSR